MIIPESFLIHFSSTSFEQLGHAFLSVRWKEERPSPTPVTNCLASSLKRESHIAKSMKTSKTYHFCTHFYMLLVHITICTDFYLLGHVWAFLLISSNVCIECSHMYMRLSFLPFIQCWYIIGYNNIGHWWVVNVVKINKQIQCFYLIFLRVVFTTTFNFCHLFVALSTN